MAVVRLDHGKVNALDIELCQAISATFAGATFAGNRISGATFAGLEVSAVVLTGAGKSFSAGVDLWRVLDGGDDYIAAFIPALVDAFAAVFTCPLPVVAAVNGHAIAGGCVFAAACDHRIMTGGRIGIPEMLVGVPFPSTALAIVQHAYGPLLARRLAYSGETLGAEEAFAQGLVDELAGPGIAAERAIAHARRLAAAIPPATFAATKRHLNRLPAGEAAEDYDRDVVRLWQERVTDGWIAAYMRRTVKSQ